MRLLLLIPVLFLAACQADSPLRTDSFDPEIEALLASMTLEEKIGQMTQLNITTLVQDSILEDYGNVSHYVLDTSKLEQLLEAFHIGSFLNGRAVSPENWVYVTETIQSINQKFSDIPIIYGIDHVHGASYLKNGTIFPHNINIGCSFDTSLAFQAARTTAYETADLGHNWLFGPVLGLGKAKSWGRYYETYSEDPLVVSRMGVAAIRGIQDSTATSPYKTAACAKHYLGYSDPKSGWDRSPAEIPDQALREFFLPPFKAAIEAGVLTMMINSGEINGIPVHASYDLLTKMLREELGFEGFIVTDWLDIIALDEMHGVAENEKEATYQAIQAGIDMSMVPVTTNFCVYLKELVEEGRISESRIDESVRRILWVKKQIGLFEQVMPRKDRLDRINSPENIKLASQAAEESMVLIRNENQLLPLSGQRILLGGSTHDSKVSLCGGWTYRFAADGDHWFPEKMLTIRDAFEAVFTDPTSGESQVSILNENHLESQAAQADVIVIATGEDHAYAETQGTIDDLALDPAQTQLIQRCLATGKPVVLILTEGRPRLIPEVEQEVDAILFAGLPGVYGAEAIADIVSGKVNPSGKMAFSYPKRSGHIIAYNHKKAEYSSIRPVSEALQRYAIAPFGYGLSYSVFEYSDLKMDTLIREAGEKLEISVVVTNVSDRPGKEAVLWFVSDLVGSITRPVKELVHFEKQEIQAGASRTFRFELDPKRDLSFPDKDGKQLLEAGRFRLEVGNLHREFILEKSVGGQ
ncbi:MAG: beta-glucosidase [Bacteroidetes bacterium]|nr:beta-glucosidase [Bacteroidota bacterium]